MNVRGICLAILFRGDTTGYDIRKASSEGDYSYFVDASFGSIYPALNRLESDGLVTCRLEPQEGKPARKVYSITEAGRSEFLKELSTPPKPDVFRSEFLLVAIYARLLGPEVIGKAIDERIHQLQQELIMLGECSNCSDDEINQDDENSALIMAAAKWTQDYGRYVLTASLTYLRENKDTLLAIARGDFPQDLTSLPFEPKALP